MEARQRRKAAWRMAGAAMAAAAFAALAVPAAAQEVFGDDGYRIARYRAPIDRDPRPAARLALPAARLLVPGRDALFIDVLPAMGGVRDAKTGQWRLGEDHLTIPGAVWHPEAGRGDPDPALWQALVAEVARARRNRPRLPVILFCRTDCWMGWNAARRLAREGHDNVWWLAEGIEGWRRFEELVVAEPVLVRGHPE